jgi:hypothetical protein
MSEGESLVGEEGGFLAKLGSSGSRVILPMVLSGTAQWSIVSSSQ